MKLLLFTKKNKNYYEFIEKCRKLFPTVKIVFSEDHLKRKHESYKEFFLELQNYEPDVILSFYYNKLIQKEIVSLSKIASLNFHGSLLPNYTGSHTINWQIVNGERQSGVTLHELTNKFDAGKILIQKKFIINDTDDANDVLKKGVCCSCNILDELLAKLRNGTKLEYKDQVVVKNIFKCKKRTPRDGEIKKSMLPYQVKNLSRALVKPWPGVYYYDVNNNKIQIDRVLSIKECEDILKEISDKYEKT